MKIFSGDLSSMEQEIKYCLEAIPRCHNKQHAYCLYRTLDTLLNFYEGLTGDATKYNRKLNKNKEFCYEQIKRALQLYNNNVEAFILSKDTNLAFANSIFGNDKELYFKNEDINTEELFFDEQDIYEIMTDYLKKYNKSTIPLFDELINEKRIYWASVDEENQSVAGYTILNSYMKRNHILLMEENNDIRLLVSLAHELGHVYDNNLVFSESEKVASSYLSISPFVETLAILEEKRFIEFLISEGIDKKRAINRLTDLHQSMFENLSKIIVLSCLPDNILRHDKYANLPKATFYNKVSNLIVDPNDESLEEPSEYSHIENPRYGYGSAIAIYLDALRKRDTLKYQEKLSKFMSLRTGYLSKEVFQTFGVTTDEMAYVITDEIESTNSNVLIKNKL